jgi:LuxR family maltose regulon positive regulatory protein
MAVQLLSTKLNIPPMRPGLVPRPRLMDRLYAGLHRKLTLVSASAGFGKTTLLGEWAGGCDCPVSWLSLDEGDNDPIRFTHYLIAALQQFDKEIGLAVSSFLRTPQLPPPDSLITALINDIAGTAGPFFLVLDDYHVIQAGWIHEAVEFLLEHMPPQMHLLLATRHDPPLSLPRLRVRDQLIELREDDLRFTADEATAFLNQALGLSLDAQIVDTLETRTEGWIAGLQLAALSMESRPEESMGDFVAAFGGSHRHVIDYLADEVLAQQPEEIRSFLRQTSFLDRLTAPLCDALMGRDDSVAILRQLELSNLFLIPLDDRRIWYRYHQLFAEFLRTDLDEADRADLHLRAARWLESQGLWTESVKHALASGDVKEAARTIGLAADSALQSTALTTLHGWLDALPERVVRESVELATYKGFVLFYRGFQGEAAFYAQAAGNKLNPDAQPASAGRLLALRAHLALSDGSYSEAIVLCREALARLDEEDYLFRGLTLNLLGQTLEWQGDVAAAADAYRAGTHTGHQAGDYVGALAAQVNLAFALNELGRLQEALALCQDFEDEARRAGPLSPSVGACNLAWSWLSYEANELDQARDQALQALRLSEGAGFSDAILRVQYTLARAYLALGEVAAARQVVQDAYQLMARLDLELPQGDWFRALEAEIHLRLGEIAAAADWAKTSRLSAHDSPGRYEEDVYIAFARLLMAQGQFAPANHLLVTMERLAGDSGRRRTLITVYLLQARILQAQGQEGAARTCVESALHLAAPQGYLRAFLEEGEPIAALLPTVRHVAPRFIDSLLDAFSRQGAPGAGQAGSPASDRPSLLIEPLTTRELEILRLIAAGQSNPEIAELLYLSLNTVKWHVKNLYGKLGVSSRVEAAARAQELELL